VAYWNFSDGVKLRRSFDGGQSFGSVIRIATRMDVWDTQDGSRFPGDFRVPSLNYLAVDPNSGTLYCIYFDTTDTQGGNHNVDLYFTKSQDQGTRWTTPRVINGEGPYVGDQFFPWIEVDAEGRLHVVYLDSRHTQQNDNTLHGMFDAYYAISVDGGDSFTEYRLTPASFDSYYSDSFMGDYLGLAVGGKYVYPCYLSTQNGDCDIFTHAITVTDNQPLMADIHTVPEAGGTVNLSLDAGMDNGGRNYLIVGGVSGTEPGFPLPGGLATLPINWDWFSDLEMSLLGTVFFQDFLGTLDEGGEAQAVFYFPGYPGSAGLVFSFAFCCNCPFDFASNAIEIEIVE